MNYSRPNDPQPPSRWWRRRPLQIVAGLLLASCCFWSGLAAWLFAPFTYFMANRMSYVHGKAELIAPAQWHPGGILSPGGRWMVAGWTRNEQRESFVWDLATGAQYPYKLGGGALCWLNPEQFAVLDSSSNTYYLVQAHNAIVRRAAQVVRSKEYPPPDGLVRIKARWQAAEKVYVLQRFGSAGTTIFTLEHGQVYVYFDPQGTEKLDRLISDVAYIRLPEYCNNPPSPAYSPDGRFYTQRSEGENAHVLIYTREGELVAEAYKNGWTPRLMGWSYDSSGVYFQMLISGSAAAGFMPDTPIFKLSPITPQEERWLIAQRIGLGVGIVAALLGAGWWWRRRGLRATSTAWRK